MIAETRGFRHFDFTLGHAQTFDLCVLSARVRPRKTPEWIVVVCKQGGLSEINELKFYY